MSVTNLQTPLCSERAWATALNPTEQLHWYAVHTYANHEKNVRRQLEFRSICSFLPLYERISRWKDRRVKLELPLFSGYIFVRMALSQKLPVLQTPGVVRMVGFNGIPAPLADDEIEAIRTGLDSKLFVEPHPFLTVGRRVRIKSGPLAGLQGILVRKRGSFRFVISLDLIERSIAADVDGADIVPLV
jgi:transcription antitermination factor NusG